MEKKNHQKKSDNSDQEFEVMTKMPPLHKQNQDAQKNVPKKDYSPLNWDLYFDQLCFLDDGTSTFRAGHQGALYFCIHGAGHSAMSFALLAKQVKHFGTLIAFDFKGHGHSKKNDHIEDLSIQTLCNESIQTLKQIMTKFPDKNVVIIGHSLGGSVAIRITQILTNVQQNQKILGLVVIDVVQGTAIQALPFMNQILEDRPQHFESLETAIKWSVSSGVLKRLESARISIPSQLEAVQHQGQKRYVWKVNLKQTEKFWLGWFKGLSGLFLKVKVAKILVTAQKQRLDKQLTIAQMQGKFKLIILHNVGHSIQEDNPKDTAKMIYHFMRDFRIPMTLSQVSQKQLIGIANFHPNLNPY